MKYFLLSLSLVTTSLISCGNDDNDDNLCCSNTTDYFPLTANSTWAFTNDTENIVTEDNMYVSGTEQSNGVEYTNLETQNGITNGFMVGVLTQNLVRKEIGKLIVNGVLGGVPIEGFPSISIPLDNVVLYDSNVAVGTELNSISDSFEETVMDFPFTISYTSTTIQGETLASYETYTDVILSRIVLNLEINTQIQLGGTTLTLPILAPQDVLVVENYYAADIGLVFSRETLDYSLADLSGIPGLEIPFPEQNTTVTTTELTSFEIGN
jgi:hypothetical protein